MLKILALAFALAACTADAPAPTPDAMGSGAGSNLPFGATCTTVSDTSTECASGVCTDSFDTLGHLCSQKCTVLQGTDPSCPQGSSGQKCNMKGYCKP